MRDQRPVRTRVSCSRRWTASGATIPLSIEKLCPVLSYYVVRDWREGCERCKQILRYGGMGHTMSIHSQNEQVILEFGLQKPAFRIVVNSPTTHGSVGSVDRPRSGDDPWLRRVRREHHVGQHLAAAPSEYQAPGLRAGAGGQPVGPGGRSRLHPRPPPVPRCRLPQLATRCRPASAPRP